MSLELLIKKSFPAGLTYNDAAQLCLRLFCSTDGVPDQLHCECSKENLSKLFSNLVKSKFVSDEAREAALYGANFHNVISEGHWIEVIASIFKGKNQVDHEIGNRLISKLVENAT